MKKCTGYIAAILFLCTSMAYAVPILDVEITDNYIGGNYGSSWDQNGGDVITLNHPDHINYFDIDWMNVLINSDGKIIVTIKTDYTIQTNVTDPYYGITYGDLFISTDGWDPVGTLGSGYTTDIYENGEDWEFVLDTSSGLNDDLQGNIHAVQNDIFLSDDVMTAPPSYYRTDQEVLYDPEDGEETAGLFEFSHNGDLISYGFNLSALGIDLEKDGLDLGFHWAMTCANDVIEGGVSLAPVPEPGTMLLLGFGLLGLGAVGRKHYPQK